MTQVTNQTILKMLSGVNETHAFFFAHTQGFFKVLSERKEMTEIELSETTGIPLRITSALVSLFAAQVSPLIEKTDGKVRFASEGAAYLDPKSSFYMGAAFDMIIRNEEFFSFKAFKKIMMEDKPLKPMFDMDEAFNQQVIDTMHAKSVGPASVWAEKIDLSHYFHLLDIGGGSGIYAINAVKRWQNLKATVFELSHIVEITNSYVKKTSVSAAHGNFWNDSFPESDIHFFSDIFHDWTEENCSLLARKSFDSLPEGGRIILHELPLNDEKTGPLRTAIFQFSVIRWTAGRQYSKSELIGFLKDAGFCQLEFIPTGYLDWALITGVKPIIST